MVKKLLKHEYLAWLRVLPIIYGIVLVVSAMLRIIQLWENDSVYYGIIFGSAIFMYVVALLVCIAAPTVFGILRFYKNLFTGEGYLSHTLPVTPANHLWVKVLTAVSFGILSVLVCLISGVIVTSGDVLTEICKAAMYLIRQIPQDTAGHIAGYAAEFALLLLIATFCSYFLYYTCICIGQLFRKNRVLAAVGVYFGFYMISQVFGTVLGVAFTILGANGMLDGILEFVSQHPMESIHVFLCSGVVLYALLTLAYYWVCHYIIRKKLNLE